MPNNNLTGSISSSFGNLSNLTALDLQDNGIGGDIPSSIGNISSLVHIDLGANVLTGDLPSSMGSLLNLEEIYLYNNSFTGNIPSSFGSLSKLRILDLFGNQLSSISFAELSNLGALEIFDISYNRLTFKDIEPIAQICTANNNLSLSYNGRVNIQISRQHNKFYVSPCGTLIYDTSRWYRPGGTLLATIVGDTTYTAADTERYYVAVTNSVATPLILNSDFYTLNFVLADSAITTTQNIIGVAPVNINDGIFKLVSLTPTSGANALNGNRNQVTHHSTRLTLAVIYSPGEE